MEPDEFKPYPRSWVLLLSCGCNTRKLRAEPYLLGEDLACLRHRRTVQVVAVDAEWKTRCLTCKGGRKSFGVAKLQAQLHADKHQRKNPSHKMQVLHGDDVVEIRMPRRNLQELPFSTGQAPF